MDRCDCIHVLLERAVPQLTVLREFLWSPLRVAIHVGDEPSPTGLVGNYLRRKGDEIVLLYHKAWETHDRPDPLAALIVPRRVGDDERLIADLAFARRVVEAHKA